jgi:hypothetical protein
MAISRAGSCLICRMVAAILVEPAWRMSPIVRLRSVAMILGRGPGPDPGGILAERDVADPVDLVLDGPVAADVAGDALGGGLAGVEAGDDENRDGGLLLPPGPVLSLPHADGAGPSGWFTGLHSSGEMRLLPERAASRRLRRPPGPPARVDHGLCGPWCRRVGTTAASPGFPIPRRRPACGPPAPLPARAAIAAVGILAGQRNNLPPMYRQRMGQRLGSRCLLGVRPKPALKRTRAERKPSFPRSSAAP